MTRAIKMCMCEGDSKRAYMRAHGGDTDWHVFGYDYMSDLCKLSKCFGRYVTKNYPCIKMVKNISPDIIEDFLTNGIMYGDSPTTVRKQYTQLAKVSKIIAHVYHCDGWQMNRVKLPEMQADKQRDKMMSEPDYNALLEHLRTGRSEAWKALVLSRHAGLRIEETANIKSGRFIPTGGRYGYGQIELLPGDGTKGNRPRICDIQSAAGARALANVMDNLQPGQYVCGHTVNGKRQPLRKDSIRRAITRGMDTLQIREMYKQNINHALRKAYAQECYDNARRDGSDKSEALAYVNVMLGHSGNRRDLNNVYIKYQW